MFFRDAVECRRNAHQWKIDIGSCTVCGKIKGKHTEMTEDTSTVYVCVFYGQVGVSACVCMSECWCYMVDGTKK